MERVLNFKDIFNQVTIIPSDTHELGLWEENTITAIELFLAEETLKAGTAANCCEIRPEIFKALTRSIPGLRIGLSNSQTFPTGMFFGNCPQRFRTFTGHL